MKTLGKLNINPSRIIKNDELKILKGGWYGHCFINCEGAYSEGWGYGSSAQEAADHLADTYSWCNGITVLCIG